MLQQLPQTITVTDLQRNPKILDNINAKGQVTIIIKGSQQVGVYTPIAVYNQIQAELERSRSQTQAEQLSSETKEKKLREDIKLIKKLAGGIKLKRDYTVEELNKAFEKSYEMLY